MAQEFPTGGAEHLLDRPVQRFSGEQMSLVTPEAFDASAPIEYDPSAVLDILESSEGREVVAIDMGGTKVSAITYRVEHGQLVKQEDRSDEFRSTDGIGYLGYLEGVAHYTAVNDIPVGIAYAGKVEGSRPVTGVNVGTFVEDLDAFHGGDFADLFPTYRFLANDAVAGLAAAAPKVKQEVPEARSMLYVIVGTGFGLALFIADQDPDSGKGKLIGTESGHVPVAAAYNPGELIVPCEMQGKHTCVERLHAGPGIARQWQELTGAPLVSEQVAYKAFQGDDRALMLYENSILAIGSVVKRVANLHSVLISPEDAVAVTHGGVFDAPGYKQHFKATMEENVNFDVQMFHFDENACAEGAALGALMRDAA